MIASERPGHRGMVWSGLDSVTNYSHVVVMSKSRVGVAELKARLSEYLRGVRKGHELTIYDREQPIARVVPYAVHTSGLVVREPVSRYRSLGDIPIPPPAALDVDVVDLLLEDRKRGR